MRVMVSATLATRPPNLSDHGTMVTKLFWSHQAFSIIRSDTMKAVQELICGISLIHLLVKYLQHRYFNMVCVSLLLQLLMARVTQVWLVFMST